MNTTGKIRVAVLYGGRSGEHEVSLVSATNVIQHLDRSRFDVVPIGIDKQGNWFLGDDVFKKELNAPTLLRLHRDAERMLFNPELIGQSVQQVQASNIKNTSALHVENISHQPLVEKERQTGVLKIDGQFLSGRIFDVIFPVIHGPLCEDGTVQGLLELANLPYVGCGVLSSSVGMDKDVSKRLIKETGILVPPYVVIKRGQWDKNQKQFCEMVSQELSYPVFVKPANTGSSVGIHKVKRPEDLTAAINDAFLYDTKVLVEQGIDAIEIEIAVLESLESGADPIISVPGEVRPTSAHEFYSYASKYVDEMGAELIIPAVLSKEVQEKIRQVAKEIFSALECEGMARVDLFLEKSTNQIYFNEVNTIPGFTKISMYPKLMAASGFHYSELLTHLITLAMARHTRKSKLSREYITT